MEKAPIELKQSSYSVASRGQKTYGQFRFPAEPQKFCCYCGSPGQAALKYATVWMKLKKQQVQKGQSDLPPRPPQKQKISRVKSTSLNQG